MPALPQLQSLPIPAEPALPASVPFPPGEAEAQRRLHAFAGDDEESSVNLYSDARDRMDLQGTSMLSPYLRFGMLSARQAVVSALSAREAVPDERARAGAETP